MTDTLLYATPTGRNPKIQYVQCMRAMELGIKTFGPRKAQDFLFTTGPVQMARCKIVEAALHGRCFEEHDHGEGKDCNVRPYDYLLMHDDDLMVQPYSPIGSPVDVWHDIMNQNPELGIMGAVYLRESLEIPNVIVQHATSSEVCHAIARFPGQAFNCAGIGTGFMLIKVKLLAQMYDIAEDEGIMPIFRFAFRTREGGTVAEDGEDYDFCKRVIKAGWKIAADPRFDTIHVKESGLLRYSWDEWEKKWADPTNDEEEAILKARVEALTAQMAPLIRPVISKDGFLIIDHTKQLEADTKAWADRVAKRRGKAAA